MINRVIMITIEYYKSIQEANLCKDFLEWQGKAVKMVELDRPNGLMDSRFSPMILIHNHRISGFKNLFKFWQDNGLFYC